MLKSGQLDLENILFNTLPQETQLGLVEIEFYGIPVESRTLPAACMDGHLPMQIRPWKILNEISYKVYEYYNKNMDGGRIM
jgi:hypothetical protein